METEITSILILTFCCLGSFSTKGGSLGITFNNNVMDLSLEQKFVDMLPNIKQLCRQSSWNILCWTKFNRWMGYSIINNKFID